MKRRAFITGMAAALAAPAIVRAESIMQVAVLRESVQTGNRLLTVEVFEKDAWATWQTVVGDIVTFDRIAQEFRVTHGPDRVIRLERVSEIAW